MLNKLSHFFMRRRKLDGTLRAVSACICHSTATAHRALRLLRTTEERFTLANFRKFMMHPEAMNTFVYSIGIAVITTLVCLLLGYPAAYILSQKQFNTSRTMVVLFISPMWVNILIRTLATVALFDFLNLPLGEGALVFGMVYNFLPFMVLPIYNVLIKIDSNVINAARDLGANPVQTFCKVIFPLSIPGVISGITMVFVPALTTFVISDLLGGGKILLIGNVIEQSFKSEQQLACGKWPVSCSDGVYSLQAWHLLQNTIKKREGQHFVSENIYRRYIWP